jgi:hypothetical protein
MKRRWSSWGVPSLLARRAHKVGFIPSPGNIEGLRVEQVLFAGARLGKGRVSARSGWVGEKERAVKGKQPTLQGRT